MDNGRVQTGKHYMKGDYIISEGAISAGLNFFGAYPITPATPIAERVSIRSLDIENLEFIQLEDEIASAVSILGASAAGAKSMTATSGPGLSLMLESIGLGYMMEIPAVIVNIMRGGPSTGMPTLTSQADIMQARWGSHGDYNMIAYMPTSLQDYYDLTISAFNASEKYRTPVMILGDQVTGLMTGKIEIPKAEDIELVERKRPPNVFDLPEEEQLAAIESYLPYDTSSGLVPPMAITGQGYGIHMTGLTHDERGYPATTPEYSSKLLKRLDAKFKQFKPEYEEYLMDDAEVCIVCFGTEARAVKAGINRSRKSGLKVGMLRMIVVWPFPYDLFRALDKRVSKIIVAEANMGQYIHPVREAIKDAHVYSLLHRGGQIHSTIQVYTKVKEVMDK